MVAVRPQVRPVLDTFLEREATLNPISRARISTRREGFVRHRAVVEGDFVHEGDLIAELDDTDRQLRLVELRAAQHRSEATLSEAKRTAARAERLFEQDVIAAGERDDLLTSLDRARAEVDEVRARVRRAEEELEELRIVAPMDSVVVARYIEEGEYLERGDPVVELKRIDTIMVICTVGERYLHDVQVGAPAIVRVTAFPGETFEGLVWKIIPDAQLDSRSFPVWVLLQNRSLRLKTGMSARVSFVRNLEHALLVPKDAVMEDGDESIVFIVSDGVAQRRVVELGEAIAESWHVRAGLSADELVVVTGNEDLDSGEAVRLTELPPPGPPTLPAELKAERGAAKGS